MPEFSFFFFFSPLGFAKGKQIDRRCYSYLILYSFFSLLSCMYNSLLPSLQIKRGQLNSDTENTSFKKVTISIQFRSFFFYHNCTSLLLLTGANLEEENQINFFCQHLYHSLHTRKSIILIYPSILNLLFRILTNQCIYERESYHYGQFY